MSRPTALYAAGLGVIMLVSLVVSSVPALAFSTYFELMFRRELCAGLFVFGCAMGALALQRHMKRAKSPWKFPQSQVSLPYLLFFVSTLFGVVLGR